MTLHEYAKEVRAMREAQKAYLLSDSHKNLVAMRKALDRIDKLTAEVLNDEEPDEQEEDDPGLDAIPDLDDPPMPK